MRLWTPKPQPGRFASSPTGQMLCDSTDYGRHSTLPSPIAPSQPDPMALAAVAGASEPANVLHRVLVTGWAMGLRLVARQTVGDVQRQSEQTQVGDADAVPDLASVIDGQPLGNRTILQFPSEAVGQNSPRRACGPSGSIVELAVSVPPHDVTGPEEARPHLGRVARWRPRLDLRQETFEGWLGDRSRLHGSIA